MTDELKVFCFITQRSEDGVSGCALSEDGELLGQVSQVRHVDTVQDQLADLCERAGRKRAEWIDHPETHEGVVAAKALNAAATTAPSAESTAGNDPDLKARRAEEHLCHTCAHAEVCPVSRESDRIYALVSGCRAFDPLAPAELRSALREMVGASS